jgi:hypothetical protein
VLKPSRYRPPLKRACSSLMQRSMTTVRLLLSPEIAASWLQMPSCTQMVLAPMARTSSMTERMSLPLRKTSTKSGTSGSEARSE